MPPPFPKPPFHNPVYLSIELLYAALIIAICLFIYFKTKELDELTKHKGIRQFRLTFLFFALAYFFRLVPQLFRLTDQHIPQFRIGFHVGYVLFAYASSMALFSLVRSSAWKYLTHPVLRRAWPYHLLAVLTALTIFLRWPMGIFLYLQLALLIVVLTTAYLHHHKRKKTSFSYSAYVLLAFFWILNIMTVTMPQFLFELKLMLYLISMTLFIIILYKVLWRTRV